MEKSIEYVVEVTKFSKKGIAQGVTQELQKPVEIRGSLLQEKVLAQIFRRKKGVHEARLVKILEPSPFRIAPRCLHSDICGGCTWQALSYQQQCLYKENHLKHLFSPYQGEAIWLPLIAMENPWSFRNKMEFSFYQDREGNKALGLIMGGTKGRVFQLQECHIARPWMAKTLLGIKQWWNTTTLQAYHRLKNEGTLQNLTLREGLSTQEKMVMLTVSGTPCSSLSHEAIETFKQAVLSSVENVTSIVLQIKHTKPKMKTQYHEMVLYGHPHIHEKLSICYPDHTIRELYFKISPTSFFQPNPGQAEKLFAAALKLVDLKNCKKILDLYCGSGVLGMIFSFIAEEVVGIELNPYAVFDAEVNHELNHIKNNKVLQGDVGKLLQQHKFTNIDLVIVDPPRAGLGKQAVEEVVSIFPKEILYVSCNPSTQIEDIQLFISKGYCVKAIQPVDQFPHGPHLENIVVLQKSG